MMMSSSGDEGDVAAFPRYEYESIEKAVMESARGRWFLQEFAKRTDEIRRPYRDKLLETKLAAISEPIRADTKAALETPADKLLKAFEALHPDDMSPREALDALYALKKALGN